MSDFLEYAMSFLAALGLLLVVLLFIVGGFLIIHGSDLTTSEEQFMQRCKEQGVGVKRCQALWYTPDDYTNLLEEVRRMEVAR